MSGMGTGASGGGWRARSGRLRASPLAGQAARFGVMTGLSAAMTLGIPVLLHEGLGVREEAAVAAAFATAFCVNFLVARRYVFRSDGRASGEVARFALTTAAFRGAEYLAFLALLRGLGLPYLAALLVVLPASAVAKFVVLRLLVFARRGGAAGAAADRSA